MKYREEKCSCGTTRREPWPDDGEVMFRDYPRCPKCGARERTPKEWDKEDGCMAVEKGRVEP